MANVSQGAGGTGKKSNPPTTTAIQNFQPTATSGPNFTGQDLDPAIAAAIAQGPEAGPGTFAAPGTPNNPGGATDTPGATTTSSTDWATTFWGNLGLPQDVINGLNDRLSGVTDSAQAQAIGQNYLTGTQWFQDTFPGYNAGLTAGLYTDPTGYRNYVNQMNVVSQQYNGTPVSSADVVANLTAGFDPQHYANIQQGKAYVQANRPELQYEGGAFGGGQFSEADLTALGNEKAGIDTAYGQKIQNQVNVALARMQKAFSGTVATPSLSLGPQGLNSPSTLGQKQGSDVAA